MTSVQIATSAANVLPFDRDAARRRWGVDPGLAVAAALFLAVLIAQAIVIAIAPPTIADISSLYVTVT